MNGFINIAVHFVIAFVGAGTGAWVAVSLYDRRWR